MIKKLVGIILVSILAVIFIAGYGYSIYGQPNQSDNAVPNLPPPESTPTQKPTPTQPPNEVQTEPPAITKPSVPEFTVELVDTSYDVPTTYSTDPYTGKIIVHLGRHVERRTIEIKIKNQPFTPPTDGNNQGIKFYYNVRTKGYFEEDWGEWAEVWQPYQMQIQSNSEYTVISFNDVGDGGFYLAPAPSMLVVSPGGQVDFQVKALVGSACEGNIYFPSEFSGKESDWSATQTITIP